MQKIETISKFEHKCAKQRGKRCATCELGITNEDKNDLKLLEKKIHQSEEIFQGIHTKNRILFEIFIFILKYR